MVELELDKSEVKTIEKALETLKKREFDVSAKPHLSVLQQPQEKQVRKHYVISTPLKVYRS